MCGQGGTPTLPTAVSDTWNGGQLGHHKEVGRHLDSVPFTEGQYLRRACLRRDPYSVDMVLYVVRESLAHHSCALTASIRPTA